MTENPPPADDPHPQERPLTPPGGLYPTEEVPGGEGTAAGPPPPTVPPMPAPPAAPPPPEPGTGYPDPYEQPPKPGTNGWAIASLVLGILGGILLSVVFGIVALVQTRRTGQSGRGMAVTGLVLSGLWLVGLVAVGVTVYLTGADRDDEGTVTTGGRVSATSVHVGDCLNDLQDSQSVAGFPAVPCSEPHEGEAFALFDLPEGDFPGVDEVFDTAQQECTDRLAGYSQSAYDDPDVSFYIIYPQQANWTRGDREVVCIAVGPEGTTRTGSIKDT